MANMGHLTIQAEINGVMSTLRPERLASYHSLIIEAHGVSTALFLGFWHVLP